MGTARGKVGDVVLSRRLGEQVSRVYVPRVNDAKSSSQVAQRSKLGNIIANYRALKTFMPRAFENKKAGQTDYNAFSGANLGASNVFMTQEATKAGAGVVAPYIISRGSLQPIQVIETTAGEFISDIALPDGFVIDDATTLGELAGAIIEANRDWRAGDQFSIVRLDQYINSTNGMPYISARLYDFTLGLNTDDPVYSVFTENVIADNGFIVISDSSFLGGVAIVHSRIEASGTLRVSPASVLLSRNNQVYAQYSGDYAMNVAVNSRGYNEPVFLRPGSGAMASGGEIGGGTTERVTGLLKNGDNVFTVEGAFDISIGDIISVRGANLNAENIILRNSGGTEISISDLITAPTTQTATNITGPAASAISVVTELSLNGIVVRSWNAGGWIDPDA